MIFTITFNPALDYVVKLSNFKVGEINRTEEENIFIGGKGLNVSRILKNIEIDNTALGFIAGFTGEKLKQSVEQYGIKTDFILVKEGMTRINVKVMSNIETAINGNGPKITEENIDKLLEKIDKINKDDFVILSGNVPKNINPIIYAVICEKLNNKGIKFVVDASEELLLMVLKYNPFMVKPNKEELAETLNTEINSKEDIISSAKKLQKMGAKNVLVSLGGEGAILVSENGDTFDMPVLTGKEVQSTVGSGDSMVAGFVAGYLKNNNYKEALQMGMACGAATACSIDLATKEEIDYFLNKIN